ncbi:MAG: hypothetical protein K8R23_01665 [Chthoniobacter sp.]|nr:hypothetical protein [Chthoniobacter sp.]
MLFSLLRIFGLSAFFLLGALQAQVPQLLNFQGRIAVAGVNFDSTAAGHAGQFKFALVDGANPPVIYWSNDGSLTGQTTANAPTASVALPVVRGLYSVMLGDATLANMTAIPASVFSSHADVRLRVWFDDGINGFQLLVPDQRIAAVGYAVMAGNAAVAQTVVDGAITSAKLADGSVSSAKLAPDIAINGTTPSALGLALFGTPDATSARIALGLGSLALQDSTTIKLVPQTVPLNPAEGWLYADSTTHGLFYYNGTAWTQPYTTPAGLLTALQGVAGTGSGLDADLLRGTTPSGLGLSLLGAADAASGRTALGLGPVATVPGTPGTFGLTMLGTVDASAGRTALGLGSLALQNSTAITTPLGVPAGTAGRNHH